MADYDPMDADNDPMRPPEFSILVGCLHCGQEYESYRIEWRVKRDANGKNVGLWSCPIPGCDGIGFGFDILPLDPEYQDEHGGWFRDGQEECDEAGEEFLAGEEDPESPGAQAAPDDELATDEDEPLPW
jgi:hypothetical protein